MMIMGQKEDFAAMVAGPEWLVDGRGKRFENSGYRHLIEASDSMADGDTIAHWNLYALHRTGRNITAYALVHGRDADEKIPPEYRKFRWEAAA